MLMHLSFDIIWNKGIACDEANTLSQLFFLVCIRIDSSLFTNKVGITCRGSLRSRDMFGICFYLHVFFFFFFFFF